MEKTCPFVRDTSGSESVICVTSLVPKEVVSQKRGVLWPLVLT